MHISNWFFISQTQINRLHSILFTNEHIGEFRVFFPNESQVARNHQSLALSLYSNFDWKDGQKRINIKCVRISDKHFQLAFKKVKNKGFMLAKMRNNSAWSLEFSFFFFGSDGVFLFPSMPDVLFSRLLICI